MKQKSYCCEKCGNMSYESFPIHEEDVRFFGLKKKRYITASCTKCGSKKLYRKDTEKGWWLFEFALDLFLEFLD